MLQAVDLALRYDGRAVLRATTIGFEAGTLTVIVGPNGAGKSSLLKLLSGEEEPTEGSIRLDGEELRLVSPAALARRRAVLPQSSALSFPFTVAEVVRLGLEAGARPSRIADIAAALARVDLAGFSGRFYGELSGGEQQRVHLARVLCQIGSPAEGGPSRLLLLDEPVSALDIGHQIAVLRIAREFVAEGGCAIAVLHDLNLAAAFADRVVALLNGEVVADGAPEAVLTTDLVAALYGIRLPVRGLPAADIPFVLPQSVAGVQDRSA